MDSAHAIPDVEIIIKGSKEYVLLLPAKIGPENWYYTTTTLHIGEQEISGESAPEMTLLRYQRRDPNKAHMYSEGATLQLAIDVDPLDEAAKKRLISKAKTAAEKWENEFYRNFTAKLKEMADKPGPKQEQWNTIHEDYENAHSKDLSARGSKETDELIDQALGDDLDSWAVEGLEESVLLLRMRNPVSLLPLPAATAQLTLYDGSGQAARTVGPTRGAAPEYATDKLAFTMQLDRNAADISEALLTSQTGLFLILRREYEVLSASLPYKIVIDYDRALREYRSNPSFLNQAVLFATYQLPEAAEKEKKDLSIRLENRGIMQAFTEDGATVPLASLGTETIQALLGRINRAVLKSEWVQSEVNLKTLRSLKDLHSMEVQKLTTAAIREPGPAFKSTGENPEVGVFALSSDAPARGGIETLKPGYRYRERKSVTSQGFLCLADYSQSVRNQLLLEEKNTEWENAYFLLPGVGDDPQLGVFQVTAKIALHIKGRKWQEQTATWHLKKGWTLEGGEKPATWGIIGFPLPEARKKFGENELLKSEFHIIQEIFCDLGKNYKLNATYKTEVFDGKSFVASPLECIQPILFDFSNFSWRMADLTFYRANIRINQRVGHTPSLRLERNSVPGRELLNLPLIRDPLAEPDIGVVTAQIRFPAREKKRQVLLNWNMNNENLVELYPALFVSIFNGDWKN